MAIKRADHVALTSKILRASGESDPLAIRAPGDEDVKWAEGVLAAAGRARDREEFAAALAAAARAPAPAPTAPPAAKRTLTTISTPLGNTPRNERNQPGSPKRQILDDPIAAAQEPVASLADTVAPARAMEF